MRGRERRDWGGMGGGENVCERDYEILEVRKENESRDSRVQSVDKVRMKFNHEEGYQTL